METQPGTTAQSQGGQASELKGTTLQEHQETLRLYCLTHRQLLCRSSSKRKKTHQKVPVEEAAEVLKELLQTLLKPLQNKQEEINTSKSNCERTLTYIQQRAGNAEQQVKEEFWKLHQFLFKEEKTALQKLKQEKKKRCQAMRGTIEKITEEVATLSNTIEEIQQLLSEDDHIRFLRKFPEIEKSCRAKRVNPVPVRVCPVVNIEQSIGSLQYRVWKKMLTVMSTAPVTLDPYTAHPHLLLSKELTSVSHSTKRQQPLLDRPERFDPHLCVLGREGYTSGKHHWEVVVGQKTEWDLGLARGSINRKEAIDLNPDSGVWIIALRYGNQYRAATKTWRHLDLREKPRKIRVCLDYEGGKVSFYNADSMSHIFTFTDRFREKLYPFLSPGNSDRGRNHEPLTICPRKVTIQEN
ncbi:zinc-binding protein A33-like isoform X2 [Scyliorhinus canicula]|uniref:zinc-binding protein A33-like isoform X2 n=1 Tax=Scyliorhinus canicula TaxID=7830 RepID=UPI0018F4F986|nr:zinc-binding protein A33-like isoform X2 [Scyliorhinus canicula]